MKKRIVCLLLSAVLVTGAINVAFASEPDYGSKYTVLMVQQALTDAGYDCGTPDGIAGSGTKGAIQKYREDKGLTAGDGIDQELLTALGLYEDIEFAPCSAAESKQLVSTDKLEKPIDEAFSKMGVQKGTLGDFGNFTAFGGIITVERMCSMPDGNDLIISCMYEPYESQPWSINYVQDAVNGRYYYLDERYEGEDLYDYSTGKLLSGEPAAAQPAEDNVNIVFYPSVNNDVTGKWRLAITDTSHPVEDYLLTYYKNYFKSDDEIHGIINTTDGTTTCVSVVLGMLNVTVHEYLPGEEKDAKLLFGGDVISEEYYDMTTGQVADF